MHVRAKPIFIQVLFVVFAFSSLSHTENQNYTIDQFGTFFSKFNFEKISLKTYDASLIDELSTCKEMIDNESSSLFNNVLAQFSSSAKLVETLVSTWAELPANRALEIEVITYLDGTKFYFDEGLSIDFDAHGNLYHIFHWDHYSNSDNDAYRQLFEGIPGFMPRNEHEFLFHGECAGNII